METFAHHIIHWYTKNSRDLPWRNTQNPYFIWLSEIILQQTRVNQGLPYYNKFIETYPTVEMLATAEEREVLKLWEGLGYYSRARNLHASAKSIANSLQGKFPTCFKSLLELKGVGQYTAAAIASFSYDERVAVVDGNVMRVLSRVFGIKEDISSGEGVKAFRELANSLLPESNSSTYNQGIMEFGAIHCTPHNPNCQNCPVQFLCYAFEKKVQNALPVKLKKITKKERFFNYYIFRYQDSILMKERQEKDIWKGLFEFYLFENKTIVKDGFFETTGKNLSCKSRLTLKPPSLVFKHILTHQTLFAQFQEVLVQKEKDFKDIARTFNLEVFNLQEVRTLPKPVLINNFLKVHDF